MIVKYKGHQKRVSEAMDRAIRMATDLNSGMDIEVVRERYPNPKTGKPYHRTHVYYLLRKIQENPIN